MSKYISYVIKLTWFIVFLLIIFIDRNNNIQKLSTIIILLLISIVTVIRSLNSRNEWRKIIEDGDVEIKEKISFDD
jgi:membrane protein YdbS with pleckstrin-like domain